MRQIIRHAEAKARIAAIGSTLSLLGRPPIFQTMSRRLEHAGVILMFHHVAPHHKDRLAINKGLEIMPETLEHVLLSLKAQDYDIVPMDAVPERLAMGGGSRRFAALTFDDGGRDNLIHAAPVLQRHEAPFTVYVTTGFASGTTAPWWHVIEQAVHAASALIINAGDGLRRFDTSDQSKKQRAARTLHDILWRASEPVRASLASELAAQARLNLAALTRELCMDWNDLRQIAALPGCTIGAHTMTHPNLAALDEGAAMREISEARDEIRERLGVAVNHFAYPYGVPDCCETREFELARQAGFATAVTTRRGLVAQGDVHSLVSLPRVPINGFYQQPQMIDALVSGLSMALAAQSAPISAKLRNGWRRPTESALKQPKPPGHHEGRAAITSQPAP